MLLNSLAHSVTHCSWGTIPLLRKPTGVSASHTELYTLGVVDTPVPTTILGIPVIQIMYSLITVQPVASSCDIPAQYSIQTMKCGFVSRECISLAVNFHIFCLQCESVLLIGLYIYSHIYFLYKLLYSFI